LERKKGEKKRQIYHKYNNTSSGRSEEIRKGKGENKPSSKTPSAGGKNSPTTVKELSRSKHEQHSAGGNHVRGGEAKPGGEKEKGRTSSIAEEKP